jgi:hypothetical protein
MERSLNTFCFRRRRLSPPTVSRKWKRHSCGGQPLQAATKMHLVVKAIRRHRPTYSITSSALMTSVCGNMSPIALAVLRLMISSNFVGS